MKKSFLIIFCTLLITQLTLAQTYQSAESVEYDPVNQQWLVSNGSRVIADDGEGNLSYFGTGSGAYGMEVLGNTVFVINNSGLIKGYDLTTEMEVASHSISGSQFLNGMTNDGVSNLYVTDFSGKRIHRIDVSDLSNITSEVIVSNTVSTPNGIVYDGGKQSINLCQLGKQCGNQNGRPERQFCFDNPINEP